MCAATAAAVTATVATVASVGMGVAQQAGAFGGGGSGGSGGFTEQQLKGFAPTKGLQSYAARLLAENATATRPSLQEFAASGGTAKYPIKDTGFTPEEAAQLKIIDPHSGLPIPFVGKDQSQLTPAQQVFLGQQRYRGGGRGPLANLGHITAQEQNLRKQMPTAGVGKASQIAGRLTKIGKRQENIRRRLGSGL